VTEKNKIFKEMLRKFMKVCFNHLSQISCQIKDNMATHLVIKPKHVLTVQQR